MFGKPCPNCAEWKKQNQIFAARLKDVEALLLSQSKDAALERKQLTDKILAYQNPYAAHLIAGGVQQTERPKVVAPRPNAPGVDLELPPVKN